LGNFKPQLNRNIFKCISSLNCLIYGMQIGVSLKKEKEIITILNFKGFPSKSQTHTHTWHHTTSLFFKSEKKFSEKFWEIHIEKRPHAEKPDRIWMYYLNQGSLTEPTIGVVAGRFLT
jgi:hypothetical protein